MFESIVVAVRASRRLVIAKTHNEPTEIESYTRNQSGFPYLCESSQSLRVRLIQSAAINSINKPLICVYAEGERIKQITLVDGFFSLAISLPYLLLVFYVFI